MSETKKSKPMVHIANEDERAADEHATSFSADSGVEAPARTAATEAGAGMQATAADTAEGAGTSQAGSSQASRASANASSTPDASATSGSHPFRNARKNAGKWLGENFPGHENAVFGGICGLVIAVLVFVIGFWQTLFISICVLIGVAIGQYVDGNPTVVNIFRSFFGGRE